MKAIGLILAAVGAWLVYQWYTGQASTTTTTDQGSGGGGDGGGGGGGGSDTTQPPPVDPSTGVKVIRPGARGRSSHRDPPRKTVIGHAGSGAHGPGRGSRHLGSHKVTA